MLLCYECMKMMKILVNMYVAMYESEMRNGCNTNVNYLCALNLRAVVCKSQSFFCNDSTHCSNVKFNVFNMFCNLHILMAL